MASIEFTWQLIRNTYLRHRSELRSGHSNFMMLSGFEDMFGGTIDLIKRTEGLKEDCHIQKERCTR